MRPRRTGAHSLLTPEKNTFQTVYLQCKVLLLANILYIHLNKPFINLQIRSFSHDKTDNSFHPRQHNDA